MFPEKMIQIRAETLGKIIRNFPEIARSKYSDLTQSQINILMMIDAPEIMLREIF